MDQVQEKELITRVLGGERHAYAPLVDAYKERIFNLAYRMTGNYHDANDLTQEAFIRAYERLRYFDRSRKFFTWLYTVALNVIRNHLKRSSRKQTFSEADPASFQEAAHPQIAAVREREYELLDRCLARLPDDIREALVLRYYQGLSLEEIAEIAEVSLSAAKMRVYRGLQKLHSLMEHDEEKNGRQM